jgi:hypothetical protein
MGWRDPLLFTLPNPAESRLPGEKAELSQKLYQGKNTGVTRGATLAQPKI